MIDDEDYDFLSKYSWHCTFQGYVARRHTYTKGKSRIILMHRIIMNCPDEYLIDHKDKNPLNNQKYNLRICTKSQNAMNSKIARNNTSGFRGVKWSEHSQKWQASIRVMGKDIYLGLFKNKKEGALVYNQAAIKYFGEYAYLNEIPIER